MFEVEYIRSHKHTHTHTRTQAHTQSTRKYFVYPTLPASEYKHEPQTHTRRKTTKKYKRTDNHNVWTVSQRAVLFECKTLHFIVLGLFTITELVLSEKKRQTPLHRENQSTATV